MRRTVLLAGTLALALAVPPPATAIPSRTLDPRVERALAAAADDLVALRRDLHRHPELAGEEARTAGLVAARLRAFGLSVRSGVGGHGVVATLTGGRPGPRVAVRADMDAARADAADPVDFASLVPGVRHICGHDVHVAVALGTAAGLAAVRRDLPGTVVFLFQPAEERATGARAMLADGALRDGRPDAIYAFHTAPLEVGQLGSRPGVMLAGRDAITVTLRGDAAALPATGRAIEDRIRALATVSGAAAFAPTSDPFIVVQNVGGVAGDAPGTWVVRATLGVSSDSLRDEAEKRARSAAAEVAGTGVSATVEYARRQVAGVDNDPALEARARAVVRTLLGDSAFVAVGTVPPAFSEDFGAFQAQAPGVMLWLGVSNAQRGTAGMPHTPAYVADEAAIGVGARAMCALVLDALGAPGN